MKPANVMLASSGAVKILDFGLAKLFQPEPSTGDAEAPTAEAMTAHGLLLGTPAYMSPEQAEGRPLDARSDVFSFGALLYELLTGRRAFEGKTALSLVTSILRDTPPPPRSLRPEIAPRLEAIVSRCLQKDPAARYPSAEALVHDLEAARAAGEKPRRSRAAWLVSAVLLLVVAAVVAWWWRREARERWARREALPEMQRLVDADEVSAAFRIAETVKPILRGDPAFERLWADITVTSMSLKTDPAGAEVRVKPYDAPDGEWRTVGRTPIEGLELARGYTRFRLEKPGFEPVDLAFAPMALARQRPFRLVRQADAPAGMVLVPGGPFKFRSAPQVELADFWLDRYEVTNRQFAEFVNAGGYRRRELWKHPFVRAGKTLSFDEAMALFRDGTGRPGPSTWELGGFPEGRGEYPVAGVSWYEAAAYAEFAGKSLPTFHHWYRAADLTRFSDILRFSNFGNQGPRPVGQQPSLTSYGNYDMAGNVREWVWNSDGERRYTLGGAWSDPTYLYTGPDALDPMDRGAILGIRCARYETAPPPAAFEPLYNVVRDATLVRPADDATFAIYRRLIEYDPLDLDARVESVDERPEHWRVEKVSFAAAYGGERIPALLFLPKNARPPFQTVIYCPPGSALFLPSIDKVGGRDFDFLVRSGRAVLFPVYQQTYQRRRQLKFGPNVVRQVLTQRTLDIRRALDYLDGRADVDHGRVAYYALSMGADLGAMVGSVETRLRTLVLVATGLDEELPPDVDAFNFAPRVRVPVLMINGRYDFTAPYQTSQVPLFRLLGTPDKDKRHAVFESGHVPPWPDVVRETLDWLDRYLGPVATAGDAAATASGAATTGGGRALAFRDLAPDALAGNRPPAPLRPPARGRRGRRACRGPPAS